jgi:hypothetical protein
LKQNDSIINYYNSTSKKVDVNDFKLGGLRFLKHNDSKLKDNRNQICLAHKEDLIKSDKASFLHKVNLNASYYGKHLLSSFYNKKQPTKVVLVAHTSTNTLPQSAISTEVINTIKLDSGILSYVGTPIYMEFNNLEKLEQELIGNLYYSDDSNKINAKGEIKQYSDINRNVTLEHIGKLKSYLIELADENVYILVRDYDRIYWQFAEGIYKDIINNDDFDITSNIKNIKTGFD